MNKKAIRYAFNEVINAAENLRCESLHHTNKHQHAPDQLCPAEYHLHKQTNIVREFMKKHDI